MATKAPTAKLMKTPGKAAPAAAVEAADTSAPEVKTKTKVSIKAKPAPEPVAEVEVAEEAEAASDDMIVQTAKEVENLKADKAFQMVPALLDNIDHDYFRLGGVLAVIQSNGWYQDKGHETFRAFVEAECGLQYRKAMYLVQIYNSLVESGIAWDKVKHLGWTKLKELANILSPENVDEWVSLAENVTVLQLQEYIKEATKGESAGDSPEVAADPSKTTTMTFKLHADQKATVREALDKAKHETGSEFDAVALEAICIDFLGATSKLKAIPSLQELMKGKSAEEVLEAFGEIFPDVTLEATM